ncbi:MAG TPA: two-component regulator propeller domain-containing protein [Chitinophagaceae bacterium]
MLSHSSIRVFIALACLFSITAKAQYYFARITEENGLSDNRVTCFLKDRTGFLWAGTKNGLNRYDGNNFKSFKPSAGNSISGEVINDIVQDSTGKIWVATMSGLSIYNPATDQWEIMMPPGGEIKGLPSYIIWDLSVDEMNRVWIASDVWDFSVYDPAVEKFTYYNWPSFIGQKQFSAFPRYRSIQKITRKSKNEWWLATTIGLFSVDIITKQFQFYGSGFNGNIRALEYDRENGNVFLVTESGKSFYYNEKNRLYEEIKIVPQSYPSAKWEKNKEVNNILLLAHPAGMLEINKTTREAVVIAHQPTLSSTLMPGGTNVIYTDDTGMLWAGTNNGINHYNSHNRSVDFIPLAIATDKASTDSMGSAYYDEIDKRYYITSLFSKELFIIDGLNGVVSSVKAINNKPLSACTNICSDRQNNLWLLTETNVYRYNRQTKTFSLFPTPNHNSPVVFNDMIEDKKGNYWFATWQDGLYQYKAKERTFYHFSIHDSISAKNITALMNDEIDDAVWVGSFNTGVYRYDQATGLMNNYTETEANPDYMQLTLVKDLETDAAGKLWLAMYVAGLYVYRHGLPYERSFTHITARQGLSNNSYFSIAADNKNRLWLLSGKGISAIDSSGKFLYDIPAHPALSFASYSPGDYYQKRIFYNKIGNELLVPVGGGLLVYYPDKKTTPVNFPVVLTDVIIDGRSVMHDPAYSGKNNIEIPFRSNSMSFRFAALNFSFGTGMLYEYKLHESDKNWKSLGTTAALNFPGLSSGSYTLMIRAKDANGNYSSNILSFSFRIVPPFWKTAWFISLVVLLLGYGFYRWTVYLRNKINAQKILNYFATSLYGQNTVEDIFWDVAKNCISQLQFADCVVYLYDTGRNVLIQKAAYGPKNPKKHEIINAIEIPAGKGIVGAVAQTGKAEIIRNTAKDSRYIMDDERRYSEITVPVFVDGKVFGVIDSEHPKKNFYKKQHLRILKDIAAICSDKISKYIIEERLRSKISRDLHDEIGSALTSINVLSKVALSKAGDQADITGYLSKIKASTSLTMESMSDIVWAINPKNDKLEALMSRMKEFAADICEAQGIGLAFSLPVELENISIDLAKRKNLFLIFKEAVNNAVKYSNCNLLQVVFENTKGKLRMSIQDNGKGFNKEAVARGNGLNNMQERAAECDGNVQIISAAEQGTNIILEIPIPRFGGVNEQGNKIL